MHANCRYLERHGMLAVKGSGCLVVVYSDVRYWVRVVVGSRLAMCFAC